MTLSWGAMLGSTADTSYASVHLAFRRISQYFLVYSDSDPEAFFLRSHAEWRSVLSPCLMLWPMHAQSTPEFGVSASIM